MRRRRVFHSLRWNLWITAAGCPQVSQPRNPGSASPKNLRQCIPENNASPESCRKPMPNRRKADPLPFRNRHPRLFRQPVSKGPRAASRSREIRKAAAPHAPVFPLRHVISPDSPPAVPGRRVSRVRLNPSVRRRRIQKRICRISCQKLIIRLRRNHRGIVSAQRK